MSIDHKSTTDNGNASVALHYNEPSYKNVNNISPRSSNSNNVTIESLSDDDDDSSIAESDSDLDEIPKSASDFIRNQMICASNQGPSHGNGVIVINECKSAENDNSSVKPNIGSIAVQNSSDITFGNKTFYQGPVTIKQFLLEKNQWRPTEEGTENKGFESSNGDVSKQNNDNSNILQNQSKKEKWQKKLFVENRPILIAICITGVAVIIGAIVFTNLYLSTIDDADKNPGDGEDWRINIPINSTIENDITGYGSSLRFVSRSEWIAQPPNSDLDNLELPSKRIIIAHTATENCSNQAMCTFRVRFIQTFHMESQGWDDIGYNFLVGGDGSAYEGRGWDKEGAHTKGFNKRSICIAFIGTFNKLIPPDRQLIAAQMLIAQGVKLKKLMPDYQLYGHRQLIPSESPGAALYDIIKTWPHWSEDYIP